MAGLSTPPPPKSKPCTSAFESSGVAAQEERTLRLTGSAGELRGALHQGVIELARPGSVEVERFEFEGSMVGHYGGDDRLIDHFVDVAARDAVADVRATGRSALAGHLLGFAAEEARLDGEVVELDDWRAAIEAGGEA